MISFYMLLTALFFLSINDYLTASASLFVALSAPGLMPKEAYPLAQKEIQSSFEKRPSFLLHSQA